MSTDGDIYYPLKILSYETLTIYVYNVSNCVAKPTTDIIAQNTPITLEIITGLTNTFEKTFYPPTSIIKITTESQWDYTSQNYTDFYILDGSLSDHPGDGYIVNWDWFIQPESATSFAKTGRKIRADPPLDWINLTVIDNYGMIGTSTLNIP